MESWSIYFVAQTYFKHKTEYVSIVLSMGGKVAIGNMTSDTGGAPPASQEMNI